MIVDGESMELVSAIEEMIEAIPGETEGEVKPELMQSVLEISTNVCRSAGEAAGQLEDLRRRVRETAEAKGLTIASAGDASVRQVGGAADRRAPALPRGRRRAALRRAPGAPVRAARARRHGRPREGDPRRERDARAPADPARALDQLALLARRADRPDVDAHADLQDLSARRHPAALRQLGRLRVARRVHGRGEGGRGLHVLLVGRAAASEPRHRRGPGLRRADAARAHDRASPR